MKDINVYGDKRRIRQIMLNLIGNAIKFTKKGYVRINIYDEKEEVKVAVSDTGIGMKKEDLDIIFERFRQADGSAKRAYEGTGLGLAITKEMVELQHGKIWVESEEGKGTTFFFTIPKKPYVIDQKEKKEKKDEIEEERLDRQEILKAAPEVEQTIKVKAKKGNGETILVVDDEPINIEALNVALSMHNYQAISSHDGVRGLKMMREKKPDVVILDVMMPGMDGFEFCKMAKQDETIKNIPIILLTAKVTTADKVEGFNIGADDYMVKPFDNEELIARIQVLLRRKTQLGTDGEKEKKPVSKTYELKQDIEKFKKEPKGHGETILVIDDEPINIEVLDSRLKLNNYVVISACDGIEGLNVAKEKMPDLIILDLMMPKMTGYEFCKAVRSNEKLKDIPLIMLTGKDAIMDKIYGYNLGADDYMTKPVNKTDLLIRVYALLRMRSLQKKLKQFAQRLSDLFGVGTTISSMFEIKELYKIITKSATHILKANRCALLLFDNNSFLTISGSVGIEKKEVTETKVKMGEAISGWVAQRKEPLLITNMEEDNKFKDRGQEKYYTNSLVSVPLLEKGEIAGVLNVERMGKPFTNDDLQILLIFANQATIAMGNAKLVEQEKKLTMRMSEAETRAKYADILEEKNGELEKAYKELKSTQKQLIQSEKLATIGLLAGGVAHEINTPLGCIFTNTEMLQSQVTNEFQKECLGFIEKSTFLCKGIVEQLLKYSRKPEQDVELVDIEQVINEACLMLEHTLTENGIVLHREYHKMQSIVGNANELGQVFTNIILNCRDAIRETFDEEKKRGNIIIKSYQEENYLIVEIKDDGVGIHGEHIGRIFDPFFTTKKVGKGTGLGLSVSQRIIENHNGKIEAESKHRQGTIFKVKLPVKNKE